MQLHLVWHCWEGLWSKSGCLVIRDVRHFSRSIYLQYVLTFVLQPESSGFPSAAFKVRQTVYLKAVHFLCPLVDIFMSCNMLKRCLKLQGIGKLEAVMVNFSSISFKMPLCSTAEYSKHLWLAPSSLFLTLYQTFEAEQGVCPVTT